MSDLFGISVSALQAFQNAIAVTSNNVANASTPGYDEEKINLTEAIPQVNGSATVGSGVAVGGTTRAYSQAATNQLNTSQSSLGQLTTLQNYTSQIDNLFGTSAGGLSTALQSFYSAWSGVANDPTSTAARQALISQAQGVASSFQNTSGQLNALNTDVNTSITSDVSQINSIATSIKNLNQQIVETQAQAGGQAPNELLDQRDQLISNLSQLVGISTSTNSDGSLNVFVSSGQPLVLEGQTNALVTVPDQFNASQLDLSTASNQGNVISVSGGDLGGLLAARTQAINPALNQLGQIATALSQSVNAQQNSGLDLAGQFGANLFSTPTALALASAKNSDATTAAVKVTNVGALTANDYLVTYKSGAYSITNAATGSAVAFTQAGNTLSADGLTITLSGTPASGDQFLVQPTAQAAASFSAILDNPSQIAAAGAIQTAAAGTNAGTATISAGTVVNAANPDLLSTATIQFTSPTQYTIDVAGAAPPLPSHAYTSGANIPPTAVDGWQVQISGTPATGDSFTVSSNAGGTGDNRNALAAADQQTAGVLANGTTSVTGAVSALITGIGSEAQQVNTAQTAQAAVNTTALTTVQSTSGVDLDQEAANLLQWQQSYQAAAQALTIGSSLFTTLIDSVNGTYT